MAKHVLFVCTGNTCRSVMAHGLLQQRLNAQAHRLQEPVEVASAGIFAIDGLTPSSETVHLLRQEGIDDSGHIAQTLTDAMIHQAGLILVMEPHHREHIIRRVPEAQRKTFLLTQYGLPETPPSLGGGIHDPIGKPMEMYERCFTDIRDAVDRVVQALLAAR